MVIELAPVLFFAYNRPKHTLNSLISLNENIGSEKCELFIFCDGAKNNSDLQNVKKVRQIVKSKKWCNKVNIIESTLNRGLSRSIIDAVRLLCDQYGKVIVVEDDLILSKYFLYYMNKALQRYNDDENVMHISGYMFPVEIDYEYDSLFLPFPNSWGWATWKRAFQYFDEDMKDYKLIQNNKKMIKRFNIDNSFDYYELLKMQWSGHIDSWAIRWYLTIFLAEGLSLFPNNSLIKNIGFDGIGTHGGTTNFYDTQLSANKISTFPKKNEVLDTHIDIIKKYFNSNNNINRKFTFKHTIKLIINKLRYF